MREEIAAAVVFLTRVVKEVCQHVMKRAVKTFEAELIWHSEHLGKLKSSVHVSSFDTITLVFVRINMFKEKSKRINFHCYLMIMESVVKEKKSIGIALSNESHVKLL